jgi:acylphosphatase
VRRIHVLVSGLVQGVNFRAFTRRRALALGVCGWVRNLSDGRVEAVAEGPDDAVADFLAACREGPPAGAVEAVEVREEAYRGEFSDFEVRYPYYY